MLEQVPFGLPPYSAPVLAAARVGIWQRDPHRDVFRADEVFADIFGLSEAECSAGIPLDRVADLVHPQDRHIFAERVQRAKQHGGLMVAQYRICPEPGVVRWILVQGCYEPAQAGEKMGAGQGIAVDLTHSLSSLSEGKRAFFVVGPDQAKVEGEVSCGVEGSDVYRLERAVFHAVAAFSEVKILGREGEHLRSAAELLLHLMGIKLAKKVSLAEDTGST